MAKWRKLLIINSLIAQLCKMHEDNSSNGTQKLEKTLQCIRRGMYDHEHEVFMECEALEEAGNSLATHDNLLLFGCIYLEICLRFA